MKLTTNIGQTVRRRAAGALLGAALVAGPLAAQAGPSLTNATLYDVDATGTNLNSTSVVNRGGWTTVLDQQNVPGNYAAELFLAATPNPTPAEFLTPQTATSIALHAGANTIYFWGDSDDTAGGAFGFGLNLFVDGAGATSPSISALAVPGAGPAATSNNTTGCTAGYTLQCTPGAGTLTAGMVTLTDFQVFARGGGTGGEDRVSSTNTMPFTPPTGSDGINDTYGSFTLVFTPSGAPEPATWAMMLLGFGGLGAAMRSRRRQAASAA
jgi:hypothetical protein